MAEDHRVYVSAQDLEDEARQLLSRDVYDWVAGGAGAELSLRENVAAYDRRRLVPRVLRDVTTISTARTIADSASSVPVVVSPIGLQRLAHPEAEVATARGAKEAGVLMIVSTASSAPLEDVAAAGGSLWFQLYCHKDRAISEDLVRRAVAAKYEAIVVTVDTPVPGRRLRTIRNGYSLAVAEYGNLDRYETSLSGRKTGFAAEVDRSLDWDGLSWLCELAPVPVIVKGVLHPEDARRATELGAGGVIVSNHGGRQLDHVPATVEVLEEVVDAVGADATVLVDGGIRRATDVLLALALGARAVGVGRPVIWALATGGCSGVADFLKGFSNEIANSMALLGVRSPDEIDRAAIR